MTDHKDVKSLPLDTSGHPTSFKVLGIEFSGPAWLAVIFIAFCLVLLVVFIPNGKKSNPEETPASEKDEKSSKPTQEDPCDVHWQKRPSSCP